MASSFMLSIVFPLSHEQLVSFVLALLVPSSLSHQVYRIICWPLSICPSYFHDTVFRSVWNPDLVPWVPSLPQDSRLIKVMLFNLSLLLILLLKHQRVMWTKLGIYLSFCVFLFLSLILLFSCSVVSHSLRPHGLQHVRFSCSSPSPGACLNSCPLSQWCHPTI